MIELRHLRKEFEDITPLEDVNVTINKGDVISVSATSNENSRGGNLAIIIFIS